MNLTRDNWDTTEWVCAWLIVIAVISIVGCALCVADYYVHWIT